MSELLDNIRSRGYWEVVIRPITFVEARVPNVRDLYPILEKTAVQLGGWDFPHLDSRNDPEIGGDWISEEISWQNHLELWRFYQSGQFFHISAMREDWYDRSDLWPAPRNWKPGSKLDIVDTVFRYTQIFELGSRLAFTQAGEEQVHIEVLVKGLKSRTLKDLPGRHPFFKDRKASIEEMPYQGQFSRIELAAQARELALTPAIDLFRRFGWDPYIEILREIQARSLGVKVT